VSIVVFSILTRRGLVRCYWRFIELLVTTFKITRRGTQLDIIDIFTAAKISNFRWQRLYLHSLINYGWWFKHSSNNNANKYKYRHNPHQRWQFYGVQDAENVWNTKE
jgi:hypothetical protein